jgi:hypothetical protein
MMLRPEREKQGFSIREEKGSPRNKELRVNGWKVREVYMG